MKITGPILKQSIDKARGWLEKQRFQVSGSLEATDICDGFERDARRVPRNICADASVEAKAAVSDSLKIGLSAIRKSVLNCLIEADAAYVAEFGTALRAAAAEYLGLQLIFAESCDELQRQIIVILFSDEQPLRLQLRVKSQIGERRAIYSENCVIPGDPDIIRTASDEDFAQLIGSLRNNTLLH